MARFDKDDITRVLRQTGAVHGISVICSTHGFVLCAFRLTGVCVTQYTPRLDAIARMVHEVTGVTPGYRTFPWFSHLIFMECGTHQNEEATPLCNARVVGAGGAQPPFGRRYGDPNQPITGGNCVYMAGDDPQIENLTLVDAGGTYCVVQDLADVSPFAALVRPVEDQQPMEVSILVDPMSLRHRTLTGSTVPIFLDVDITSFIFAYTILRDKCTDWHDVCFSVWTAASTRTIAAGVIPEHSTISGSSVVSTIRLLSPGDTDADTQHTVSAIIRATTTTHTSIVTEALALLNRITVMSRVCDAVMKGVTDNSATLATLTDRPLSDISVIHTYQQAVIGLYATEAEWMLISGCRPVDGQHYGITINWVAYGNEKMHTIEVNPQDVHGSVLPGLRNMQKKAALSPNESTEAHTLGLTDAINDTIRAWTSVHDTCLAWCPLDYNPVPIA